MNTNTPSNHNQQMKKEIASAAGLKTNSASVQMNNVCGQLPCFQHKSNASSIDLAQHTLNIRS
jgi:hypothetical protein